VVMKGEGAKCFLFSWVSPPEGGEKREGLAQRPSSGHPHFLAVGGS
jgi:hypothetical protein